MSLSAEITEKVLSDPLSRDPKDWEVDLFECEGIFAKKMFLPKDHVAISHSHNYDHLSIVAKGRVLVTCDNVVSEYEQGDGVIIKRGINHAIHALEDTIWFCIHNEEVALCRG